MPKSSAENGACAVLQPRTSPPAAADSPDGSISSVHGLSSGDRISRVTGMSEATATTQVRVRRASSSAVVCATRAGHPATRTHGASADNVRGNSRTSPAGTRTSSGTVTQSASLQDAGRTPTEEAFRPSISEASRFMASFTRPSFRGGQNQDGSIHERLYREAQENRRKKEEMRELVCAAEERKVMKRNPRHKRAKPGVVEEKLYCLAQIRRQQMQMVEAQAREHLRSLRDAPKLGARSQAVYRQRLYRELRAAVDWVQPDNPGCPTLDNELLSAVFQIMGIFREDHVGQLACREPVGSSQFPSAQEQKKPSATSTVAKKLLADYRISHEKALAARVADKLDVECSGRIPVDTLFSFLAAVTTQLSILRTSVGETQEQRSHLNSVSDECLREASKELQCFGQRQRAQPLPPSCPTKAFRQHESEIGDAELLQQLDKEMSRLIRTFGFLMITRERKRESLLCSTDLTEAVLDAMEDATFHPRIDPQSEIIATKNRAKVLEKLGPLSLPDRLVAYAHAVEAVKEKLRAEHAEEELRDCTFHPKIKPLRSSYSCSTRDLSDSHLTWSTLSNVKCTAESKTLGTAGSTFGHSNNSAGRGRRGWSCDAKQRINRWDALYFEGQKHIEKLQETVKHIKALQDEAELQECTFAPNVRRQTHKSPPSRKPTEPPGYISTISRMRKAAEKREQLLRLQESRDPSASARGPHTYRRNTKPQPFSFEEGRYKVQLAAEVFTMTVEVGKGKKGKMSVREGEDPRLVARSFCRAYSLQAEEADWLTGVLVDAMTQRDLIAFVPDETGFGRSPVARRKDPPEGRKVSPDNVAWDSPVRRQEKYSPSASPSSRAVRLLQQEQPEQKQHGSRSPLGLREVVKNKDQPLSKVTPASASSSDFVSCLASALPPETARLRSFSPKSPLQIASFGEPGSRSGESYGGRVNTAPGRPSRLNTPRTNEVLHGGGKDRLLKHQREADVFHSEADNKNEKPVCTGQTKHPQYAPTRQGKFLAEDSAGRQAVTSERAAQDQSKLSRVPEKGDTKRQIVPGHAERNTSPFGRGTSSPVAANLSVQQERLSGAAAVHAMGKLPAVSGAGASTPANFARTTVHSSHTTVIAVSSRSDKASCDAGTSRQSEQRQLQEDQEISKQPLSTASTNMPRHPRPESTALRIRVSGSFQEDTFEGRPRDTSSFPEHLESQKRESEQEQQSQAQCPQVWEASSFVYDRSYATESSTLPNILRVTNIGSLEWSQPVVPSERSHTLIAADCVSRTEAAAASPVELVLASEEENQHSPAPTTLYSSVDHNTDAQSFASVSLSSDEAEKGAVGVKKPTRSA